MLEYWNLIHAVSFVLVLYTVILYFHTIWKRENDYKLFRRYVVIISGYKCYNIVKQYLEFNLIISSTVPSTCFSKHCNLHMYLCNNTTGIFVDRSLITGWHNILLYNSWWEHEGDIPNNLIQTPHRIYFLNWFNNFEVYPTNIYIQLMRKLRE